MYRNTLTIIVLTALSLSFGQDVQEGQSNNPIARLNQFINQVSSSEEHLLHMERVGPYTVNADGQRLVEHPYLKFDITKDGEPLIADTKVTMESRLYVYTKDPLIRTYEAVYDGERFVVDPLDLEPLEQVDHTYGGEMAFDLVISEGETEERRSFELDYYSPRPEVSFLFRLMNTLIPIIVLVLAFVVFKFGGLKRNQVVSTRV